MNNVIKKAQENIGPSPVVIPEKQDPFINPAEKTGNIVNEVKLQISNSVIDFMMTRIQYAGVNSNDFVLYIKAQLKSLLDREQDSVWEKLNRNKIPQIAKIISDKFSSNDYFNTLLTNFKAQSGADNSLAPLESKGWTYSQWGSTLKYLKARAIDQYNNAITSGKSDKEIEAIKQTKQGYFNQVNVLFSAYNALYSKASETPGFDPNTSAPTMSELQNISRQFGTGKGFGGPGGRNSGFGSGGRGGDVGGGVDADQISQVLLKHPFLGAANRSRDFLPIKELLNAYSLNGKYPTIMAAKTPVLPKQIWQEGNVVEAKRNGFSNVDFAKYVREADAAIKEIIELYLEENGTASDKRQVNEGNNYLAGISRIKSNVGATREEQADFASSEAKNLMGRKIQVAEAAGFKKHPDQNVWYKRSGPEGNRITVIYPNGSMKRSENGGAADSYKSIGEISDENIRTS